MITFQSHHMCAIGRISYIAMILQAVMKKHQEHMWQKYNSLHAFKEGATL